MTKQEILNLIDTTIKPNNKKAISAQSLQNVLREMAEASGSESGEGGGGGGENTPTSLMVEITYSELVRLRASGNLVPGTKYRIIDYVTTTSQENTRSTEKPFDVIVTALTNDYLSEDAKVMHSARDTEYFWLNKLNAWSIKYSLDNDKSRFEFACGGKCIKFSISGFIDLAFRHTGESVTQNGATYYKWDLGYELEGIRYVYTASENPIVGDIMYVDLSDLTNEDNMLPITDILYEPEGKGVIYEMIDEFGNQAPYDFKNIQFKVWSPSFGVLLPYLYFEPTEGYQEDYFYTFGGSGQEDYSLYGKKTASVGSSSMTMDVIYNILNNKVVYTPIRLLPLVVSPNLNLKQISTNYFESSFELNNNLVTDCEKSILHINSNCRISKCYNVCIQADDYTHSNIIIDVMKNSDGNPLDVRDTPASVETATYMGKNSQGEVKIWNPADLIA